MRLKTVLSKWDKTLKMSKNDQTVKASKILKAAENCQNQQNCKTPQNCEIFEARITVKLGQICQI